MSLISISSFSRDFFRGRRVLLRLDLNVPVRSGQVVSDFRLRRVKPTIEFLQQAGAEVVIIGHIDQPGCQTLKPVAGKLAITTPLNFVEDLESFPAVNPGEVVLLENLRRHSGEESNDKSFASLLVKKSNADFYVNDAFAASHRKHASITLLPSFLPSAAGLVMAEEVASLSRAFTPEHPFVLILGGAKFGTKLPLVKRFLPLVDKIFIGGALAHSFFRAKGFATGRSLVDDDPGMITEYLANPKIVLPDEVMVKTASGTIKNIPPQEVSSGDIIYDAGPDFLSAIKQAIVSSRFIVWNGPLGNFEAGFSTATKELANLIAEVEAYSIVGGGDTIAAIESLVIFSRLGFVSTGGGAMLDFLATGTLPGIEALLHSGNKTHGTDPLPHSYY
jgi:phosphoglycerate kinase